MWSGGRMDYKQGIIDLVGGITQESALEFYYTLILITSSDEETMRALDEGTVENA